jgi:hypothetical protein
MTRRVCWRLVERVSRLLDASEREVVRGDLAECGSRPGHALREVFGLVVRRQAALWVDWRPWFAVVGVVVPISACRRVGGGDRLGNEGRLDVLEGQVVSRCGRSIDRRRYFNVNVISTCTATSAGLPSRVPAFQVHSLRASTAC